jgi:hypothetical protein
MFWRLPNTRIGNCTLVKSFWSVAPGVPFLRSTLYSCGRICSPPWNITDGLTVTTRLMNTLPGDPMSNRNLQWLIVGCLMTGTLWAADNPFVGKWKVDPPKSKLYDEMKVEFAGSNRYAITFGPGQVDTVVADGSDQPALSGTTLSITVKGTNSWEVIRKLNGRTLLTADWTLSEDGKALNDAFTQYLPDGTTLFSQPLPNNSTLFLPYVYQRTGGNSGFLGTWDSESAKVNARVELQIQPYESDGLSLKRSDEDMATTIKLDGKDYSDSALNGGDKGTVVSSRRVNELSLEVTEKSKGNITVTRQIELSRDLKTLTVTVGAVGQSKPQSILVYRRE